MNEGEGSLNKSKHNAVKYNFFFKVVIYIYIYTNIARKLIEP